MYSRNSNCYRLSFAATLIIVGQLRPAIVAADGDKIHENSMDGLLSSASSSSSSSKCVAFAEQRISKCLQPMLEYAGKLQEETGTMQLPVQGNNIFKKLCDVYNHFKECTHDLSCSSIALEAVDASYGYMCGAGYKLFEDQATCFAEVETEHDYVKCKNEAGTAIAVAQKAKDSNDYNEYFKQLCKIMDEYLRCSHPVINRHCGSEAWELVRTVTLDSLRVTMPTCDLHNALL